MKYLRLFPSNGPFRRELYPKHIEFFAAGKAHRERCFMAANRVGKTEAGAYEATLHLTGNYPDWWPGRRFAKPTNGWAAGDTSKTVREILQDKLLGPRGQYGTGMIPGDLIVHTTAKQGLSDAIDTIWVRHSSGGVSSVVLKSYDQRREGFQGTAKDWIWLDEEPDEAIYAECLVRTMTTNGLILLTFTPLMGLSQVVLSFLPGGEMPKPGTARKFVVCATWDDVPHLTEEAKRELWDSLPAYQKEARSKGTPSLGAGAIYPIPEEDFLVAPFDIPEHWPRVYGMDVGWKRTACVWLAHDRDTETSYLHAEHYRGEAEPVVHAAAVKSRGDWIPGVIDPGARGRGQSDGNQLLQNYRDLGLHLEAAVNAVESGIDKVYTGFSAGKIKVFASLANWRQERRLYRRDEKGRIVKEQDHLMDATRYVIVSGPERWKRKPVKKERREGLAGGHSWMA